jgi:hypothetical protein
MQGKVYGRGEGMLIEEKDEGTIHNAKVVEGVERM